MHYDRLRAEGHWVFAGGLAAPSSATVIDNRGGEAMFTDGPFLESKEYLAGFWIIRISALQPLAIGVRQFPVSPVQDEQWPHDGCEAGRLCAQRTVHDHQGASAAWSTLGRLPSLPSCREAPAPSVTTDSPRAGMEITS
jgi:hypothetical protein